MNTTLGFIRLLFVFICVIFLITYTTMTSVDGFTAANVLLGLIGGVIFGLALIGAELLLKRFNLRAFNTVMVGLLFGYLMGETVLLLIKTILDFSSLSVPPETIALFRLGIFLFAAYIGTVITVRAADEIYASIPFIKFKPTSHTKKDILMDASALMDARIIDLANSGILDYCLVIPRFSVKELTAMLEVADETIKARARRSLETLKKLENMSTLELRYSEVDFPDLKDPIAKLTRLARDLDANIITADMSRIQQAQLEGIRIININLLSHALKPITQAGESIHIKVQRYGKEPRQGVGYLEDGTMVVVNGGAEYIGETIKAQVLSVKHTSSGRMIFCNAVDENMPIDHNLEQSVSDLETTHKNYFAL